MPHRTRLSVPTVPRSARSAVIGAATLAGLLAGCSSSGGGGDAKSGTAAASGTAKQDAADARVANVTITAAKGCTSDKTSFPAGAITVKIVNKDATAVSEVELLSGERILGEKENIPPGFSGEFAVDVPAGSYTLYCPGAATERTTLKVTGKSDQHNRHHGRRAAQAGHRRLREVRDHPGGRVADRGAGVRQDAARHRPRRRPRPRT